MRKKCISVIVPCYNAEKYLKQCVNSIQNQTYVNLEIILVDDGSPDACLQICDALAAEDSRIRVVHQKNAGSGMARNAGLSVATGEYVSFIDSDDWISETHMEDLYAALIKYDADIAMGHHMKVSVVGEAIGEKKIYTERQFDEERIVEQLIIPLIGTDENCKKDIALPSSASTNLYKMSIIHENNLVFLSERNVVSEDFFFNLDYLHHAKKVVQIPGIGYFYRENANSITHRYDAQRVERTLKYYTILQERLNRYGLQGIVGYRAERTFLMKLRVALRLIVVSDLSKKEKVRFIHNILENDIVVNVLNTYPIEAYIPALRMLAKAMRSKKALRVYHLIMMREYGRRSTLLKVLLKKIGVGNHLR